MDILSHGLWGALAAKAYNRRSAQAGRTRARLDPLLAFTYGIFPDFVAFATVTLYALLGLVTDGIEPENLRRVGGHPDLSVFPPELLALTSGIYNISHSFVMFAFFFCLAWAVRMLFLRMGAPGRRPPWEMLAWPFHILIDIPTHGGEFFPTPFLWPLSDLRIDGIPWFHPLIWSANWLGLVLLYLWVRERKRPKAPTQSEEASELAPEPVRAR